MQNMRFRKILKSILASFWIGEMPLKVGDKVALRKDKFMYYHYVGVVKSYNPKKKKYKVYFPTWNNGIHANIREKDLVKR